MDTPLIFLSIYISIKGIPLWMLLTMVSMPALPLILIFSQCAVVAQSHISMRRFGLTIWQAKLDEIGVERGSASQLLLLPALIIVDKVTHKIVGEIVETQYKKKDIERIAHIIENGAVGGPR